MQQKIINIHTISQSDYCRYYALMSEKKRQRVDRFRFSQDKKRTVAAEMLARQMIAQFCALNEETIEFSQTESGKPYAPGLAVEFNTSHSGDFVICALSETNNAIGADIEKITDISQSLVRRVCTRQELNYVCESGISEQEMNKRFFEIWTFKEAYFKCLGTGLGALETVDFFDSDKQHRQSYLYEEEYMVCIYCEKADA